MQNDRKRGKTGGKFSALISNQSHGSYAIVMLKTMTPEYKTQQKNKIFETLCLTRSAAVCALCLWGKKIHTSVK